MNYRNLFFRKQAPLLLAGACFVFLVSVSIVGCKKKEVMPQANPQAFDNAPADIKEMWAQALEADRTNGFYNAQVLLYTIVRTDPSAPFAEEARKELGVVGVHFQEALKQGLPEALAAQDELRKMPPNRVGASSGR